MLIILAAETRAPEHCRETGVDLGRSHQPACLLRVVGAESLEGQVRGRHLSPVDCFQRGSKTVDKPDRASSDLNAWQLESNRDAKREKPGFLVRIAW